MILLAAVGLFSTGCAVARLEPPRLEVVEVGLLSASVLKQDLRLRMRVHNPNDMELPVRGLTYEVQLSGETFATGESERNIVVPALGQTEFNLDVSANAAAAVLRLLGDRAGNNPQYRVLGRLHLSGGLIRSIPFEHKGELKLR